MRRLLKRRQENKPLLLLLPLLLRLLLRLLPLLLLLLRMLLPMLLPMLWRGIYQKAITGKNPRLQQVQRGLTVGGGAGGISDPPALQQSGQ